MSTKTYTAEDWVADNYAKLFQELSIYSYPQLTPYDGGNYFSLRLPLYTWDGETYADFGTRVPAWIDARETGTDQPFVISLTIGDDAMGYECNDVNGNEYDLFTQEEWVDAPKTAGDVRRFLYATAHDLQDAMNACDFGEIN